MRAFHLALPLAMTLAVGACTSGGGGSGAPVAPIAAPFVTPTPTAGPTAGPTASPAPPVASFALSIVIPTRILLSAGRSPRYVSPGTASFAVYDGTTLLFVGNYNQSANPQITTVFAKTGATGVTGGSCAAAGTGSTCTITIVTTPGAHSFDAVTYPVSQGAGATSIGRTPRDIGTPPTFTGVILAEGELTVTLVAGPNPGQTVTTLGVADKAVFTNPVLTQHLNGNGALVGIIGTSYTFQYVIDDAANFQIVQPPATYDNGPVQILEDDDGDILTMTNISQTAPPAAAGPQSFTVTCAANGTADIAAVVQSKPTATYASALTYSASNYPTVTIGTTTLQCVPNSATLPVTVQGVRR